MKVIDCEAVQKKKESPRALEGWLSSLKLTGSAQDVEAQEIVITSFQRLMDNKYFLLRNVTLAGLELPLPLLLVGPPGIWAIFPSGLRGVYRAKADSWEKIDERQKEFKPTGENLLTRAVILGKAVESKLVESAFQYPNVEAVVIFTNPGIHIETVRPVVRLVLVDALERFISGVVQGRLELDADQVQQVVDLFSAPPTEFPGVTESLPPEQDKGKTTGQMRPFAAGAERLEQVDHAFSRLEKLPFSSRQWLILGLLILINILVLAGFVLYLIYAT
jgi:hypothetical protein